MVTKQELGNQRKNVILNGTKWSEESRKKKQSMDSSLRSE
jgi:hypothetical protein